MDTNAVPTNIPGIDLLPASWQGPALIVLVLFPYVTRGYYALANGGGLVGVARAILWGTNSIKPKTENTETKP